MSKKGVLTIPRHWKLPVALLLAVLLAFTFVLSTHAEGVTNTIDQNAVFQAGSPCTGEAVTFYGHAHGISRLTVDPNSGRYQEIFDFQFHGAGTGASGTTYEFTNVISNLFIFNVQAGLQSTTFFQQNFLVVSHGPTPNFYLDMAGHATVNPDGSTAVFFDRFSEICQSS